MLLLLAIITTIKPLLFWMHIKVTVVVDDLL